MEKQTIDIIQVYKYSFNQFKKYASFIIGCSTTYFVLAIIPQVYFILRAPADPTTESQIVNFLLTLVQLYLGVGFIKIMLYLIDDNTVQVSDFFNNSRIFLSYFVASFLYGAAVIIGLILLIIPGIYIAIRFQFYPYYIIEYEDNSFTALQKSFRATQNLVLELFLFGITVVVINLVGVLLFGIGALFAYPLTTLATAVIYKSFAEDTVHLPHSNYRIG